MSLVGQIADITQFENSEVYFSGDQLHFTTTTGRGSSEKRIYWTSRYSFDGDSGDSQVIRFTWHDGKPIDAPITSSADRMILMIGGREFAFKRGEATNLRIERSIK
jgi:hypothetical protein